jgi:hypothetical protein
MERRDAMETRGNSKINGIQISPGLGTTAKEETWTKFLKKG